jgi:poly(3-hydroxybutyrate) depolymerase
MHPIKKRKSRDRLAALALMTGWIIAAATALPAAEVTIEPGVKQLFLDDAAIERLSNIQSTVHQVQKCGPILKPDNPWENAYLQTRGGPLWNPQANRWELRYFASTTCKTVEESFTCLAVSTDGLNWTKPNLGIHAYQGSKANNIVCVGTAEKLLYHVLYDPRDPDPQRRWKALIGERNPRPAASPDGVNWTFLSDHHIPAGEESFLFFDHRSGEYVFTLRTKDANDYRAVNLATSRDFVHWSDQTLIMAADETDQQLAVPWIQKQLADKTMRQPWMNNPAQYHAEVYNMGVFPYHGLYIGVPTMFRVTCHNEQVPSSDGFSVPGLAVSRDLRHWRRVGADRPDFIPLSPVEPGVYDTAQIESPGQPIVKGEELWFYYSALKYRCNSDRKHSGEDTGAICRAKLRLDGFVSLDAGEDEGTILTQPLKWQGKTLWVNADAAGGNLRVEVLDADGRPLESKYSLKDAIPVDKDSVRLPVSWKSVADLGQFDGKAIRLRFHLRRAKLYAFWSENGELLGTPPLEAQRRKIMVASSVDGTPQANYLMFPQEMSEQGPPRPLLVSLHTWNADVEQRQPDMEAAALRRGWFYLFPNFRGANDHPDACASPRAQQDIIDAVQWVAAHYPIDRARIYLTGKSGGGHIAMMMAARWPSRWAAVSAWVGISDLASWHARHAEDQYGQMLRQCCGGRPGDSPDVDLQYRNRSPLPFLAGAIDVPLELAAGVHDGHAGSVPIRQTLDAFNAVARAQNAQVVGDDEIEQLSRPNGRLDHPRPDDQKDDPKFGRAIYLRRTAGKARVTIFEGGHEWIAEAAADWLEQHVKPSSPRENRIEPSTPIQLDSRLELLLDDWLIESMDNLRFELHQPRLAERVLEFDKPWENRPHCGYVTVFQDDDRYRMYYNCNLDPKTPYGRNQATCYAESRDGVHWTKPTLGIIEFNGSKENNMILRGDRFHNFAPFMDRRPGIPADQRYKAVAGCPLKGDPQPGLFVSADAIHWRLVGEVLVPGPYDSQNVAFWDATQGQYVFYFRIFEGNNGRMVPPGEGVRHIARTTSSDFLDWSEARSIQLGDSPREHLYTNATIPYFRAPHLYLSFPNRMVNLRLPPVEVRWPAVSDAVFMFSRDGIHFDRRYMESFLRPGPEPWNWTKHSGMIAWGILPTSEREISLYVEQNACSPLNKHIARAVLRTDGFVSLRAPYAGGEFVTKPFIFDGEKLVINAETSAAGNVRAEIQDAAGKPLPGYRLEDCIEFYGDEISHPVSWRGGKDVGKLVGKPVRLRFVLRDADLYSLRFAPAATR